MSQDKLSPDWKDGPDRRTFLAGAGMVVGGGPLMARSAASQPIDPAWYQLHPTGASEQDEFTLTMAIQPSENVSFEEVEVIGIDWQIDVPFDDQTGRTSGARQPTPLVVMLPIHPDTPRLFEILANGVSLESVTISAFTAGGRRRDDALVFEIRIADCELISLRTHAPGLTETMAFLYETITLVNADGDSHGEPWRPGTN